MLQQIPILSLITFSPLLGIVVLAFIPGSQGRWIKFVGIAATIIPLLLSAWLFAGFDANAEQMQFKEQVPWIEIPLNKEIDLNQIASYFFRFDYSLAVDGLSLPLVFLTALVTAMAALASTHIKKRWKTFYIFFLLLETGMFGVFMAQDLFLFFVFFELTLIPMFFLIGIWGYMKREKAANTFLIYNGIGSAIMLIAFFILVNTAGLSIIQNGNDVTLYYSGDLQTIANNLLHDANSLANRMLEGNPFFLSEGMRWALFFTLLAAFGIKLPIFPFHTWMLKVHTEAPPSVVMIHSGILLKMGAYGFIRFGVLLFPQQAKAGAIVLAVLGLINILYGAILAFKQNEFKLILAYSSISHMGIVLLGIAAFNQIGMAGAIFQLISHGLISALMFLIVGSLYERTATTEVDKLGGLAASMPFMCGMLMLAGMALLGLPLLSGFVSEFLAFLGLFKSMPIVTVIGAFGVILTAVYVLRGVLRITFGKMPDQFGSLRDTRLIETVPMITLAAFILLIGIYPSIVSESFFQTVSGFDQLMQTVSKMGG